MPTCFYTNVRRCTQPFANVNPHKIQQCWALDTNKLPHALFWYEKLWSVSASSLHAQAQAIALGLWVPKQTLQRACHRHCMCGP